MLEIHHPEHTAGLTVLMNFHDDDGPANDDSLLTVLIGVHWRAHDNIVVLALWTPTNVISSKETLRPNASRCDRTNDLSQITPLLRDMGARKTGRCISEPTSVTRKSGLRFENWCFVSANAWTKMGYQIDTQELVPSRPRKPSVKIPNGIDLRVGFVRAEKPSKLLLWSCKTWWFHPLCISPS